MSESFILERGFSEIVINNLVDEGFIEKCDKDLYRMSYSTLKDFMGENSWNWNNAWFGKNLFSESSLEEHRRSIVITKAEMDDIANRAEVRLTKEAKAEFQSLSDKIQVAEGRSNISRSMSDSKKLNQKQER